MIWHDLYTHKSNTICTYVLYGRSDKSHLNRRRTHLVEEASAAVGQREVSEGGKSNYYVETHRLSPWIN